MKLPEPVEKIKDMKHAKWIGLALALILNLVLMAFSLFYMDPYTGYYILMIGLVAISFATLYIFGWREGKQMVIIGIIMFIVIGAIWGPMKVHYDYSLPEPDSASSYTHINWFTRSITELDVGDYSVGGTVYAEDVGIYETGGVIYALDEGTLTPYQGAVGESYEFRITLYSNGTFTTPPEVMLAYASSSYGDIETPFMAEVNSSDTDYIDGKDFHYITTFDKPGIYSHTFSVNFQGEHRNSLNTTVEFGPLVGEESESYGIYALIGIPSMFCNIGMLFIILVLLYWWIGTAKEKRKAWDMDLLDKEEVREKEMTGDDDDDDKPFTCDQCGAGVGADDNFCPKCGDRFDEVDGEELDSEETETPKEEDAASSEDKE